MSEIDETGEIETAIGTHVPARVEIVAPARGSVFAGAFVVVRPGTFHLNLRTRCARIPPNTPRLTLVPRLAFRSPVLRLATSYGQD